MSPVLSLGNVIYWMTLGGSNSDFLQHTSTESPGAQRETSRPAHGAGTEQEYGGRVMNTSCPPVTLSISAPARKPAARGFFTSLERLIDTAGFVSTDLTDTVFASLPRPDGAPREAVVRTNCSE